MKPARINKSKSSCCVPECCITGYVKEEGTNISFHWLPKNDSLLKKWLVKMRRDTGPKFTIGNHTKVCSRHFIDGDFSITEKGRRFLKRNAIPSIFSWTASPKVRKQNDRSANLNQTQPAEAEAQESCQLELANQQVSGSSDENELLRSRIKLLEESAAMFQRERDYLRSELLIMKQNQRKTFNLERFKFSDEHISFYTGFPSHKMMMLCMKLLNPGENGQNIRYCNSVVNPTRTPRQRKLKIEDEFFMVLIRLRLGTFERQLADMFEVSQASVTRICTTWINFMYLRFGSINMCPSDENIKKTMPASIKEKYPNLTWMIDAFEIQCERPSSLYLASQSYSNYKSRNTLKGLIGCTPSGQIGFISQLYTGSISDRELTIRSGFLRLPHKKGSMWLVDKGFQIQDLADPLGVKVNMPAFVGKKGQMTEQEVFHTQQVASERIHVERAINKVKNFHIFSRPIPLSILGSVNQMWSICAFMTLMHNPIISA